jgi:putative serine protease PepD
LVVELTTGGAAEMAGIKPNDVITHFNGSPVTSASELTAAVRQEPAGAKARLDILRDGIKLTIEVVLQDAASVD